MSRQQKWVFFFTSSSFHCHHSEVCPKLGHPRIPMCLHHFPYGKNNATFWGQSPIFRHTSTESMLIDVNSNSISHTKVYDLYYIYIYKYTYECISGDLPSIQDWLISAGRRNSALTSTLAPLGAADLVESWLRTSTLWERSASTFFQRHRCVYSITLCLNLPTYTSIYIYIIIHIYIYTHYNYTS